MVKNKLCNKLLALCGILICAAVIFVSVTCLDASESNVIFSEGGDFRNYISGTGTYFDWVRAFYKDGNDRVAYCTQSDKAPAVEDDEAYTINGAVIVGSEHIHKAITAIACNGYPLKYGKYAVKGSKKNVDYKSGLIIGDKFFECTEDEARAATAFAIHRKMLDYVETDQEYSEGNNVTITTIENGRDAVNDVKKIQDTLYKSSNVDYKINMYWVEKNDNGGYSKVTKPEAVSTDGKNLDYYIMITSYNCYVDKIELLTGDKYLSSAVIHNIEYDSVFKKYVHIKVPKTNGSGKKIGVKCYSYVSAEEKATTLGSENYQDFIIIPEGENVEKSISTDYPGGDLTVSKTDSSTGFPIAGAVYGIYEDSKCSKLVTKVETDSDGQGTVQNIETGKYYVKEIASPDGYSLNTDIIPITVKGGEQSEVKTVNTPVGICIEIEKRDRETDSTNAQGDGTLIGAEYGLYAKTDINYPDGKTGLVYSKDELICTLKIGEDCKAKKDGLIPGKYYIKELKAPVGYVMDDTTYDIDCSCVDYTKKTLTEKCIVLETPKKQAFQLIKYSGETGSEQQPLKQAGFSAWLLSELSVDETGEYDFTSASPYPIADDGSTEMFTDEKGYACSAELPYGTYLVKETTVPSGYKPVKDFIVVIDKDSRTPQVWRLFNDDSFSARLKIIKKDADTKRNILKPGFEFKIYDMDNECYVEQETSYPEYKLHKSYMTGEEGFLILPKELAPGNYRIEEVSCPDDSKYLLNPDTVEVQISDDKLYKLEDGIPVIEVEFSNKPVYGTLKVKKLLELQGVFGKSISKEKTMEFKVSFELYAAEDIYCYDCYTDELGNREKLLSANQLVKSFDIDMRNGNDAVIEGLPLGKYYLKEIETIPGYVLTDKPLYVELKYADAMTEVVSEEITVVNEPTETKIYKKDKADQKNLSGARLSLVDSKGNVVTEWTSDEYAHKVYGLVIGEKYTIHEESAPEGYDTGEDVVFTLEQNKQEINIYNEKSKLVLGEKGKLKDTPNTGDPLKIIAYALLALSLVGIAIVLLRFSPKGR
ncbi:MAG: hypothetical protein K2G45_09880 [Lachnospiraceae bacterium]|nr:hypothetical protein [Lachnospiraceae bacterium]